MYIAKSCSFSFLLFFFFNDTANVYLVSDKCYASLKMIMGLSLYRVSQLKWLENVLEDHWYS